MLPSRAVEILNALIQGTDPVSGAPLPPDCALHHAEVLRALLTAVDALGQAAARAQRRAQLPVNVGRPWSEEEQAALVAAFKAGEAPEVLAEKHRRTLRAIEARLERLGLLSAEERITRGGFSGVSDASPVRRVRPMRPQRAASAARQLRRTRR